MNALETALYAALTGDATLTALLSSASAVYNQQAPQGAEFPFVIVQQMARTPVWTLDEISLEDTIYQVKGVTVGQSMKTAGDIADAIDGVLNDGDLTITGYALRYSRRTGAVSYTETVDGKRFNHQGAMYRIMADPT